MAAAQIVPRDEHGGAVGVLTKRRECGQDGEAGEDGGEAAAVLEDEAMDPVHARTLGKFLLTVLSAVHRCRRDQAADSLPVLLAGAELVNDESDEVELEEAELSLAAGLAVSLEVEL